MARVLVMAVVVAAFCAAPAAAQDHLDPKFLESIDDAQLHGTITPPGADTRHATTEIAAYDDLVQALSRTLTRTSRLGDFFKLRRFGEAIDARAHATSRARA